ncbi:ARM repeat-containing protein, partial [Aureobasidium melanogenum]
MSDIQLYLVEADKNKDEARRLAARSAAALANGDLKLVELIETAGEYINHEDATMRIKSLSYLADVLEQVAPKVLKGQQRNLLCGFILTRVSDDSEGTGHCARALMALERLGKWDSDTAANIANTFVSDSQTLRDHKLQSERFTILQLLDLLLRNYRKALKDLHNDDHDFLARFITYFDGEKDPRNLMIVFSILQVPMTEWDLGPHAQDLFDSVFNYFPITFKPPPGDPYGITAQDLKGRLQDCISTSSDFAPYSFPALLDKLDSSSINTKRDVLAALKACVNNYEPTTISLYSVTLWDSLKFEILNVEEEDLAQEALAILAAIASQLSKVQEGALTAYLKPVIKECNEHLEDAPTKQSQAAGRIINSIAKTSPELANTLTKAVLPHLFELFQSSESIAKRRGLIEVLNSLISATKDVSDQWKIYNAEGILVADRADESALRDWSAEALEAMLRAVINAPKSEVSFRLFAIAGLIGMIKIPKLLADSDVSRIIESFTDIIIQERSAANSEVEGAAISGLAVAAHHSPTVTSEKALPTFLAELPDNPTLGSGYEKVLEAFTKLSTETQVFDTIVLRLKNKLQAALHQQANITYIHALLMAILFAFSNGSPGTEDGVIKFSYFSDIAKPLLDQALGLSEGGSRSLSDHTSTDIIGRISNIILKSQTMHLQNQVLAEYESSFSSFGRDSSDAYSKAAVIASLHLNAAFQREALSPESATNLLGALARTAADQSTLPDVQLSALRQAALVVNKFIPPADLEQSLISTSMDVASLLGQSRSSESIILAFSIVKGLLVQGKSNKYTTAYLQSLLELLSDTTFGSVAARGFVTILAPDDILSKENHCYVSGLYKQKTFNQTVPVISTSSKTADSAVKSNYLVALSGILRWLPYSIIENSLSTLVLLLLQSLDLQDQAHQDVKSATLATLETIITQNASALFEHSSSLISRLLACTAAPDNTPQVRKAALRCLTHLPTQFKREAVVPYRRQVVKRLMACLDDGKRAVRTEAVRCRTAWLSLDQEDSDEE